jgi:hypothetical protein
MKEAEQKDNEGRMKRRWMVGYDVVVKWGEGRRREGSKDQRRIPQGWNTSTLVHVS